MAEIQLKNLTKRWGSFVGVDNFNLTIHDEEFLVLLGPSGCGKTTTLRMIAGLEDVTEGEVIIDGKIVNGLEPKDRDVAMVFQSYALYPNMNVYENIRFPLKVRKIDRELHDERVMRAAAMVELEDFLHRKPSQKEVVIATQSKRAVQTLHYQRRSANLFVLLPLGYSPIKFWSLPHVIALKVPPLDSHNCRSSSSLFVCLIKLSN